MGTADLRMERLIAASDHLLIAKAAFRVAVQLMPTARLYLRHHRARVIETGQIIAAYAPALVALLGATRVTG